MDLQDAIFHATTSYSHVQMNYKPVFLPVTTDTINTLIGLGSDSIPVTVSLHKAKTFLADSMHFNLKHPLRLGENVGGTYYIENSFSSEDPDSTLLNQLYHTKWELTGSLNDGVAVVNRYLIYLTEAILKGNTPSIISIAGQYQAHHLRSRAFQENWGPVSSYHLCRSPQDTPDCFQALPLETDSG